MKWEKREQQWRLEMSPQQAKRERLTALLTSPRPVTGAEINEILEDVRKAPIKHPPSAEPPRLSGKVIAYRAWTLDGYRLGSANRAQHGGYWDIGPNKAACLIRQRAEYLHGIGDDYGRQSLLAQAAEEHDAPHPDCECGLYAYFTAGDGGRRMHFNPGNHPVVWGAVTAWGRIEVHRDGIRAEYAEPVALAYNPRDAYEDVIRAQTVAGEFGLPFVTLDDLPAEAAKHGQEVPAEMRPARESAADLLPSWMSGSAFASGGYVGPMYPTFEPHVWTEPEPPRNPVAAREFGEWLGLQALLHRPEGILKLKLRESEYERTMMMSSPPPEVMAEVRKWLGR